VQGQLESLEQLENEADAGPGVSLLYFRDGGLGDVDALSQPPLRFTARDASFAKRRAKFFYCAGMHRPFLSGIFLFMPSRNILQDAQ
jgi:hypothetical protein